jgi:hypothetical protein
LDFFLVLGKGGRFCVCHVGTDRDGLFLLHVQDLKDYMRQAGEVTYADAHTQRRNEGYVYFNNNNYYYLYQRFTILSLFSVMQGC